MSQTKVLSEKSIQNINSKKQRKFQFLAHKSEVAKQNRNSGKQYTGRNGVTHNAKSAPDKAKICSNSCQLPGCRLPIQKRVELFEKFYEFGNYNQQMVFLTGLIQRHLPARRTAGASVIRTSSFKYTLLDAGIKVSVCQATFMDTFKIGKNRIRTIHDRLKNENYSASDRRGAHENRPHRLSAQLIGKIQRHIDSFPAEISVKCEYTKQFHKKKLRFGAPRADTCKTCDKFSIQLSSAIGIPVRRRIEQETLAHHLESETGYSKIDEDIHNYRFDDTVVLCVDLQQILFCPTLTHADVFYQRQFGTYNFCIWNARTDVATMCLWDESEGKRGSTELCSCLLKYIQTNFNLLVPGESRKLVVWSDRCVGQNNNYLTLALYKFILHSGYFSEIIQKFMVSGHSFLPCDRLFALIEQRKRISTVYVPEQWTDVIQSARPTNPFQILKMKTEDFLDLDSLLELIPRPNTLKVTEIAFAKMTVDAPDLILTKESRKDITPWDQHTISCPYSKGMRHDDRASWTPNWITDLNFGPKYSQPIPISAAKKADLVSMTQYIPPQFRAFYNNLLSA